MTYNTKKGAGVILTVLFMVLFFSCDTTLNESIDSEITTERVIYLDGKIFEHTQSGVRFVGEKSGTSVTLTMYNTMGTATVEFRLITRSSNNSITTNSIKKYTLYRNVPQKDYFYLPVGGDIALSNIIVTRP